jgi:uncharacterized membrane protein YgdD (TMEM256/DUF423 family)
MKYLWLTIGIFGAAGVVMGAIGAHAVHGADIDARSAFDTAVRYHLIHALAAGLALSLAARAGRLAVISAAIFLLSILCFSGSIYLRALADIWIPLAPVGGIGFMIGWLLLGVSGWRAVSKD